MNLRDLRYLIATADLRHFGKAAEACHVSQPTLSGQIRKLEDELGVALFERTNRAVTVTPIGTDILAHARIALEQAEEIVRLAKVARDPLVGQLRLGLIPTLSPALMPLFLNRLLKQLPRLEPVLSEATTDNLVQRLLAHEIDAALLASPVDDPSLEAAPLFDEPFWLAYPADHRAGTLARIGSAELSELPMLLLEDGHCLRDQVTDLCRVRRTAQVAAGLADLRATSLETLINLVAAGMGCTLLPALQAERLREAAPRRRGQAPSRVLVRKVDMPAARRTVYLASRKSFPRAAMLARVADLIRESVPPDIVRRR